VRCPATQLYAKTPPLFVAIFTSYATPDVIVRPVVGIARVTVHVACGTREVTELTALVTRTVPVTLVQVVELIGYVISFPLT